MSESDCLQLLQKCNAELAALREKLAAADRDFHGLDKQWSDRYRSEKRLAAEEMADFRATVAAALAELRAQWNAQYQHYVSLTDEGSWERRQELLTRMRELDATIAKLDLQEQPK